jgi:hypothetical protein
MGENPWWHPSKADLDGAEPLPDEIELAPDYSADLPLWGCDGSGMIDWRDTRFAPELLDRLAAWQREFDDNYHWDTGWRSTEVRDRWTSQIRDLAEDVRAQLGSRARLIVRLWPLGK